ncbi:MAG: type II toxin-antitoxin system RelE/ParE family toxin [Spirochaetales bacterium]|nr:type II toxin-antitoxin system RelE/ParE family toxin [Spirochaetales bacterium]
MVYKVQIIKKVIKYLSTLRKKDAERIFSAIENLASDSIPSGHKKLSGEENAYRIRIGSYCVIYVIEDDALMVYVLKAGARGDVYKKSLTLTVRS